MQDLSKCAIVLLLLISSIIATARAGTLLRCEPISTIAGFKYVGTYCIDYECKFIVRKMFDEYCPYLLPEK